MQKKHPPALDPQQSHRRAVLGALLVATALGGLLFFVINMHRGQIVLALVELGMAGYATAIFAVIRRTAYLKRWTLLYLVPFFTVMMLALATPGVSTTIFVWVLLIPILSHLLLGRRLGFWMSLAYLGAAGGIYVVKNLGHPEYLSAVSIANVTVSSLAILAFSHVYELSRERAERRLMDLASTDALTGLANRTKFGEFFERECKRAQRGKRPLSLVLIDMDHFKQVNDRFGHDTGDAALRFTARILGERLRSTDLPCRFGGEEFAVLLPDTTLAHAERVAEALRAGVANTPFEFKGQEVPLTLSAGVGQLGTDGDTLERLYAAVDAKLYACKARGRNCVVSESQGPVKRGRADSAA